MKKVITIVLALVMYMGTNASTPFITKWDLSIAGSGATQITFGVANIGPVIYSWTQLTGGSATGSGSFGGTTASIIGLPAGSIIELSIDSIDFTQFSMNSGIDKNRLLDVEQWGSVAWSTMGYAFYACSNLNITATDLPNLTGVNDMSFMFYQCSILNGPSNIGSWNTSSVTDMGSLFAYDGMFNQPIDNWNTSAVINMRGIFQGTAAFNQPIGSWNTSSVISMEEMFREASAFNQPIGTWNTSAVTTMRYMFWNASAFNQPIGTWNTSSVIIMDGMFLSASAFNQPIGSWNTSAVTEMNSMFALASAFNQPIGSWNTSAVHNMYGMFAYAYAFNQSLAAWNLSSPSNLLYMLDSCGMDCANYSATLVGWNANSNTPNGLSLGAIGMQYGTTAVAARTNLTTTKGWTITGDSASGTACLTTVGISSINNPISEIDIYPNPATTQLTIQQLNNSTIETIHIYNVLGEEVQSSGFGHRTSVALDVSALNKGIYFIEASLIRGNNNKIIRKKFVKE